MRLFLLSLTDADSSLIFCQTSQLSLLFFRPPSIFGWVHRMLKYFPTWFLNSWRLKWTIILFFICYINIFHHHKRQKAKMLHILTHICMVVWWFESLSECSLHVLSVYAWVLYGYFGFLPPSKNMHGRLIRIAKLSLGLSLSRTMSRLSLCGPVMDWRPIQGVPRLSPNDSWERLKTYSLIQDKRYN